MAENGIGASVPRTEDQRFLTGTGDYTLRLASQNPHIHRLVLAAFIQIAPEHKLHVIAPDVGGGFGSKIFIYQEETAVLWAAGKLGRPVKWTADRSESFVADAHGRDHETHAELALDAGGRFLRLRVETRANMGAYLSTFAQLVSDYLGVPFENVEVVHGDTEKTPFGMGTYGSRSLAVGVSPALKRVSLGRQTRPSFARSGPQAHEFQCGRDARAPGERPGSTAMTMAPRGLRRGSGRE